MKKSLLVVMVCLAFIFGCKSETPKQAEAPKPATAPAATPAAAPAPPAVAGGTVLGVSVSEIVAVVNGWSIKKQIMGKDVYNDKGEKIGKVDDLIVSPDKAISYAIIGAGGFLGIVSLGFVSDMYPVQSQVVDFFGFVGRYFLHHDFIEASLFVH